MLIGCIAVQHGVARSFEHAVRPGRYDAATGSTLASRVTSMRVTGVSPFTGTRLDLLDHVQPVDDAAEHRVLAVERRRAAPAR